MIRAIVIAIPALVVLYLLVLAVLPWDKKRRLRDLASHGFGIGATVLALIPLGLLIGYLVYAGLPGLNAEFFTQTQKPLGESGSGMLHAILGTFLIVTLACLIGVPIGVGAGIYLSEFGRGKFANSVRFLAEVLSGLPSIVAGILGYAIFVAPNAQRYSALAGAIALSFLMIPVITRVTEEAMRLVPNGIREASYALGAGPFNTIWKVVLPAARGAVLTGIVLAVTRVAGETAPLLFTSAGQSIVNWNPTEATAALPLSIFLNATQPFENSQKLAITGALVLVMWVAIVNITMRVLEARIKARLTGGK